MNRRQRRAGGARKPVPTHVHAAIGDALGIVPLNEMRPEGRYLEMKLRPMTIADMIPGHPYRPGTSILTINLPATTDQMGYLYLVPLQMPEGYRDPTPENTQLAFLIATSTDPEVAETVAWMKGLARPRHEVEAARGLPMEISGPVIQHPRGDAA